MTLPVYYVDSLYDAPASTESLEPSHRADALIGTNIIVEGDEARHAATVRRTRIGEHIDLVDGCGLRATLEVTAVEKSRIAGVVREAVYEPAHARKITLIQALAKAGRDEQAIEIATEYGVDAVMPWQADRCVSRWEGTAKRSRGLDKWMATVRAAAKQSRRSWIPTVLPLVDSQELVAWVETQCAQGAVVFICHEEGSDRLTDALIRIVASEAEIVDGKSEAGNAVRSIAFIVGPEGGITDMERRELEAAGARTVLLGEHVMRASSAGSWGIAVTRAFLPAALQKAAQ